MKVYIVTINWSGWSDPEADGCLVEVFSTKQKALNYMRKAIKQEREAWLKCGREFCEDSRLKDYVSMMGLGSECVEFDITAKELA